MAKHKKIYLLPTTCISLPLSSAVVKKEYSYTPTPPMGRKAHTEPKCLYKGALYLYLYNMHFFTLILNNLMH